ncbi:MAG: carboxypeptidase regulatory-like domain-containing protein [Vicinamibacterales bacterium]
MSRTRVLVVALSALLAVVPAFAQVQTGSILVRVSDEQGGGVPGATVTIASSALIAGSATGVTDTAGAYRFPSLPPGSYTIRAELSGFQTLVRESVTVVVGQTTPIDLVMRVAALAETVTVTGASPVIDTTSATVAVNLSEQLLQSTPGGRDIWSLVEYKVPSLLITRPDVGGTSGGLQGVYNARGTSSAQNSQYLNGINVGDPAAIGAAGFYYDFDAFEDIQVSTGAHDITVPTSGVFLNMLTKSGGDRWSGRTTFTWLGDATQSSNIDDTLLRYGFRPETNAVDFVSDINVSGGGPIIARKLRVFASVRDWRVHVNVPAAFSTTVLDKTDITSGLINGTYQLNTNHRLTGFYSRQYYKKPNRFLAASNTLVEESTSNEDDVFDVVQGLWNGILTRNLFVDARFGLNKIKFPTYQNGTDQTLLDTATGIRTRNFNADTERFRDRYQANATFQYYLDQALGGRHEFKFGFDHAHAPVEVRTRRVDDLELTYSSTTGRSGNVTLFATPFFTRTAVDVTALYFQDSYSVKRLTLTGGLRWERLEGYLPAQSSPASRWFPELQRDFPETRDLVLWHTAGPRLSAAYDVRGDGRTALKASAGRYYYVLSTGGTPLDNVNPNSNYSALYAWNDLNGDLRFQDGEQSGTPVITSGTTTSVDTDFSRPFTDEYTVGLDQEIGPAVRVSAVFTYRREDNPQATYNPANPYATTLTTAADAGPDGVAGTSDDTTYQYYDRLSATNLTVVSNDPTALQTYKGLEITATKRMSNRWQVLAGYTYARTRISGLSVNVNPNNLLNVNGVLTGQNTGANGQLGDRPHQFKLTGTYVLPWYDVGLAANFNVQSGIPVTRQVSTRLSVGGTTNVNVEAPGSHRLDTRSVLDLRIFKTVRFGTRELEGSIDVNNLTNRNTVWDVRTLSGTLGFRQAGNPSGALNVLPQFLSPSQVYGPRNVRINVAFRF